MIFRWISYEPALCYNFYIGLLTALFLYQGRTALWDSILLLCHKIKVGYGGIIRGMHLGASALSILPVMEAESED